MTSFASLCRLLLAAGAFATLAALAADAKTLRIASGNDPQSMDPHALALLYHTRVVSQIYESLVNRDENYRIVPALAESWQTVNNTTWRFKLRAGVTFHDGAAFTADDAVFSIERALAKTSQRAFQMKGITGARKVDERTIDVLLSAPDAVLPEKLWLIGIMSRAWATKHNVLLPQDYNGKQETHAVRNANGTGPFVLARYEADRQVVLKANAQWWGRTAQKNVGNVTEAVFTVIGSDATRMAALKSGQADIVIDPPFQDIARLRQEGSLKLAGITDIGTQYLGFDQHRAELEGSDVKGKNPFRDVRVRRAVMHAIDVNLIIDKVLRGGAVPTGSFLSDRVDGIAPETGKRPAFDPTHARALLKEAGYGDGFSVTLDCVNITYRAAVCQSIAAMLTQVGIRVSLQTSPGAQFFPKLTQATAGFFEVGWTPGTDPWAMLNAMVRTHDGKGAGTFNGGRYSNPKLDAAIDAILIAPNLDKRRALVADALKLMQDDLPLVPLYRRTLTWAMTPKVNVVQWPNDVLELRWVRMQ
jgi:peptide/nickel transport system substrate-binding protein